MISSDLIKTRKDEDAKRKVDKKTGRHEREVKRE